MRDFVAGFFELFLPVDRSLRLKRRCSIFRDEYERLHVLLALVTACRSTIGRMYNETARLYVRKKVR